MKLTLKRFSQEVSISSPDNVEYFLVFDVGDTGREIRLPVLQQTTETLVKFMYGEEEKTPVVKEVPEEADAEVFTAEKEARPLDGITDPDETISMYQVPDEVPNEEEIPSL